MNVHVLVSEINGLLDVEVFSSRMKMTTKKTSMNSGRKCYMFPPVNVGRDVKGLLQIAKLVNDIHVRGPVKVLEGMEDDIDD